jgi:hypothetical protein
MRLTRVRFRMRSMLGVIALLAILLAIGRWSYSRYISRGITKTYYVGDLVGVWVQPDGSIVFRASKSIVFPASLNSKLTDEANLLKSSITPDVWWFGTRTVSPAPPAAGLTVLQTKEGHEKVAAWFKQRRLSFWATQGDQGHKESASRAAPPTQPALR